MAETEKKEKSFWDFRDTILEGGILDVVGTQEKMKAEKARKKAMEDRTGWSLLRVPVLALPLVPRGQHPVRESTLGRRRWCPWASSLRVGTLGRDGRSVPGLARTLPALSF